MVKKTAANLEENNHKKIVRVLTKKVRVLTKKVRVLTIKVGNILKMLRMA